MIERTNLLLHPRVLLIDDKLALPHSAGGRAVAELAREFRERAVDVVEATTIEDGEAVVISDASISCVFLDWTIGGNDEAIHQAAEDLLRKLRHRRTDVPVFLMADRAANHTPGVGVMSLVNEFVWMLEDTAPFIAGRALAAIRRYQAELLPPFTKSLLAYTATREHSWAAPGHQGGVAFTKTPEGRVFFDYFGENLFRTDTGIERTPMGSLLDHEGAIGEAEKYAARVFGSHLSYSVLNGTSGSNRSIISAVVNDNDFALCDRNCHKSIEQGLVISGGIPVFLRPTRNRYGIIGPIPPEEFSPASIAAKVAEHPLKGKAAGERPVYAVVTNCTYDGMCYDAARVQELLGESVDTIHFDEAWYAYARFNPIYRDRHAMRGDPASHPADGPTVFATHSTHKLLAALSQASYIHVRNGRRPIVHSRFNEAYMAQASTSPLYAIIASNEIGAAMMDRGHGLALTDEVLGEAVDFRQALARAHREFARRGDWFFEPWNAPEVNDPSTGERVPFADAPRELLTGDPDCWILHPGEKWHGFEGIPDGWCMLDPIKVGIVCPGMGTDGNLSDAGLPAAVLSSYLYRRGIIPSRTTDFMVLCLFSVGITKGKWGTLINALLNFKEAWDANEPLEHVLPEIAAAGGKLYKGMGVRDLSTAMFERMKKSAMDRAQAEAFGNLPRPELSPRAANSLLMRGEVDLLPLDQMAGRTIAVGAIPYPPGIPVLMPGENCGPDDGPWLSYLRAMEAWGREFPGFEKIVEGAVTEDGRYQFWCVKN